MPRLHVGPRDPLSDELIRVRHALGENQEQFAKRLGISRTSLLRYELYDPPRVPASRRYIEYAVSRARHALAMRKRRQRQYRASAHL
jgi:hypothetical protein